jgi:hypothetical protein
VATKQQQLQIIVPMSKDKETKNTWRYQADNEEAPLPTAYLEKSVAEALGETIVVSLTKGQ